MEYEFETTVQSARAIADLFDEFHLSDKAGLEVLALMVSDVISTPVGGSSKEFADYFANKFNKFLDAQLLDQPT